MKFQALRADLYVMEELQDCLLPTVRYMPDMNQKDSQQGRNADL